MNSYCVRYIQAGGSCSSTIKAASAGDAKAIAESKGNATYPVIVHEVSGPDGAIRYMSYGDAVRLAKP
jgi:hypothetical protein